MLSMLCLLLYQMYNKLSDVKQNEYRSEPNWIRNG